MIPAEILARVIGGVRNGRYSVVLGAGFSVAATSSDGRHLPLSRELADELAALLGLEPGYALSQLWDALPTPEREDYLLRRLRNCEVSPDTIPLHRFVWRSIYTYNVDDVVEQLYRGSSGQQSLLSVTHRTPFRRPESLGEVLCIHMHGSVSRPEDGFVFSTVEYGGSTAQHGAWGPALADEILSQPFIIIGCALDEYDLEYHIARRGTLESARDPMPSLWVAHQPDAVLRRRAERRGFICVDATAADFLRYLESTVAPIKTPTELSAPASTIDLYTSPPANREQRIFHRQFLCVRAGELPEDGGHRDLLTGRAPLWHDFEMRADIIRADTNVLLNHVRDSFRGQAASLSVIMVSSPPGSGKSTLLMRLALELSEAGHPTFYFVGAERLSPISTAACLSALRTRGVILIDNLDEHQRQVMQLIQRLGDQRTPATIVGAERHTHIDKLVARLGSPRPVVVDIRPLSDTEAREVVQRMRGSGLLGRNAALPDEPLVLKARGRDLVVALCEIAGDGRRFDDLLLDVWEKARMGGHDLVLAPLALAHSFGYSLKVGILQELAGVPMHELLTAIGSGSLRSLVYREGYGGEYVRTAHRVIAERLIDVCMKPETTFNTYVRLAMRIAPFVSRQTIKSRSPEARLASKLLDYEPHVRRRLGNASRSFYESIRVAWEWNARYWEQLALLESRDNNHEIAVKYAEHAVGVEGHPLTHTTLGKVLLNAALSLADEGEAFERYDEAMMALADARARARRDGWLDEHAFHVAIDGTIKIYTKWRIRPDSVDVDTMADLLTEAERELPRSMDWRALRRKWEQLL